MMLVSKMAVLLIIFVFLLVVLGGLLLEWEGGALD